MLVIIDANVFVSAANQRGASHRIIESWLGGSADFEVVMCPELLRKVREVLTTRPRLRKWINLENATLFGDTLEAVVDLVDDPDEVQTETRETRTTTTSSHSRELTMSTPSSRAARTSWNGRNSGRPS